jgi:hypothetical protein
MDMHAYHHAKLQGLGLMKRVACRVLPPHVLEQMKFELHMFWVRLGARQTRRAFQGGKDLLVNVGAGDTGRKGWVNVDGFRGSLQGGERGRRGGGVVEARRISKTPVLGRR